MLLEAKDALKALELGQQSNLDYSEEYILMGVGVMALASEGPVGWESVELRVGSTLKLGSSSIIAKA